MMNIIKELLSKGDNEIVLNEARRQSEHLISSINLLQATLRDDLYVSGFCGDGKVNDSDVIVSSPITIKNSKATLRVRYSIVKSGSIAGYVKSVEVTAWTLE